MRQAIYLDILFLLNMLVTFLLLMAASQLSAVRARRWRLIVSVLLGGVFSLLIFVELHPVESFIVKLLTGSALTAAAFFQKGKSRLYWKVTACFFLVSFLFAGFITAVFLLFPAQGMLYRNGVLYFNISAFMLAVSATAAYTLIQLICRILDRRGTKKTVKTVRIAQQGAEVTLTALVDTGNRLRDLFSGLPVMVASYETVKALIPQEQRLYAMTGIPPDEARPMLRLIPVKTVAGEQLLPSFQPEQVLVDGEERKAILAISPVALSDGSYDAVLHPALT